MKSFFSEDSLNYRPSQNSFSSCEDFKVCLFLQHSGRSVLEETVNSLSGSLNTKNSMWALGGVNFVRLD